MRRVLVRPPGRTRLGRNRLFTPVFGQEFTFRNFFTGRFRGVFLLLFLGDGLSMDRFGVRRNPTSAISDDSGFLGGIEIE